MGFQGKVVNDSCNETLAETCLESIPTLLNAMVVLLYRCDDDKHIMIGR